VFSDAAAAIGGSLGMVAGANVGDSFVIGEPGISYSNIQLHTQFSVVDFNE
jgi:isocitrate/isopropylmalate dehydrogenase